MNVTKAMIHSVRNASAKRVEAGKKKADEEAAEANKRKRINEEKHLQAKKARIEQSANEETASVTAELKKLQNTLKS